MKMIQTISRMVEIMSALLLALTFVGMWTDMSMIMALIYLVVSINGVIWGHFFGNLMELKMRKRNKSRITCDISPFDLDLIEYRRVV